MTHCVHSSRANSIVDANLSFTQTFITVPNDFISSSHIGQVDNMHNCDVLPGPCGRHNESERDGAESSDEMLTAQGTLRIQRDFCLMRIARTLDGGTHIFGSEEHHYYGPVISVTK